MKEHFGKEHEEAFGEEISGGGYPDMGNGRYVMKAGYRNWMEFNKGQRIHQNFAEYIM